MSGKKPVKKPASPAPKPGDGLMGWLGRQVGHVKKAVQTDVTKTPRPGGPRAAPRPSPAAEAAPPPEAAQGAEATAGGTIIYRDDKVEEVEHPTQPGVKLRRTIIDEVILEEKEEKEKKGE